MKIVIAPDSFKECLPSTRVAEVLAQALRVQFPQTQMALLPLADGGEGTLDVLTRIEEVTRCEVTVQDPLGRPVKAAMGIRGTTAFLEVAQACGLSLLAPGERTPLKVHTRGVGELILAAYDRGCRQFIVGLGGSATCDGGAGMLSVPGVKDILGKVQVTLLCDVETPFIGPKGAVRVFAPQKGASPAELEILEARMADLARQMQQETSLDVSMRKGAGAAGGLAGALMAYAKAEYTSGAQRIMDLVGFDEALSGANLVITGEGKSDGQTLLGKVPYAVLRRSAGLPVALVSGRIEDRPALEQAGFSPIVEVTPRDLPLPEALKEENAIRNLTLAAQALHLD